MTQFQLLAAPLPVNLLILVPFAAGWWWWRSGLALGPHRLTVLAVWGIAFGVVEAVIVVYLRAITAAATGIPVTLGVISALPTTAPMDVISALPADLLTVEAWRESATMAMLVTVAWLACTGLRERVAGFLWAFAVWDLAYYAGLWSIIRWPPSLFTPDVLFLIPNPWIGQVWFPVLVSTLTLAAVAAGAARHRNVAVRTSDVEA